VGTPHPEAEELPMEIKIGVQQATRELTLESDETPAAVEKLVSEAVAADDDTAAYVDELESRADEEDSEPEELPSGDALAAELTRFLRDRDKRSSGEPDEH
jgi:hypothetical protein